jgi:hypothetical protein
LYLVDLEHDSTKKGQKSQGKLKLMEWYNSLKKIDSSAKESTHLALPKKLPKELTILFIFLFVMYVLYALVIDQLSKPEYVKYINLCPVLKGQEELVSCSSDYSTRWLALSKHSTMCKIFFDPRNEISIPNYPHYHTSKVSLVSPLARINFQSWIFLR